MPANNTFGSDPVAALAKLKSVYDSLPENQKRTESGLITKRGFWHWLHMAWEAPGLTDRSLNSTSVSSILSREENHLTDIYISQISTDNQNPSAVLSKLKAIYDSLPESERDSLSENQKRTESGLITKRGFWHWLHMAWEAPGLTDRSLNSTSVSSILSREENHLTDIYISQISTDNQNPSAVLSKLKAIYDSLPESERDSLPENQKRTESGLIAKRGFWHWLKMAFEAPGMKARSIIEVIPENNTS